MDADFGSAGAVDEAGSELDEELTEFSAPAFGASPFELPALLLAPEA